MRQASFRGLGRLSPARSGTRATSPVRRSHYGASSSRTLKTASHTPLSPFVTLESTLMVSSSSSEWLGCSFLKLA